MNHKKILQQSNIHITAFNPLTSGGKAAPNDMRQRDYDYISADAGAGKTTYMIKKAIPNYLKHGYSVLILVPTIKLANQIERDGKGMIKAIHSEQKTKKGDKSTLGRILEYIGSSSKSFPVALVICDVSFIQNIDRFMSMEKKFQNWICFKDEPEDPLNISNLEHISDEAKRFIAENITDMSNPKDKLTSRLTPINFKPKFALHDKECAIFGKLAEMKSLINNDYCEVLIDNEALSDNKLKYSVFMEPVCFDMFAKVIFMKANFEHSFVYTQWISRGVNWSRLDPGLRKLDSSRLQIHYCLNSTSEYSGWSNYMMDKDIEGNSMFELMQDIINELLPDGNYVYVVNNARNDDRIKLIGQNMPAVCHGLNNYSHHTKVVLLASYKVHQSDEPFYAHYNSSTTDAISLRETQYHVQQITRTDIRNYDSTSTVDVYVPTIHEALALSVYFPKAKLIDVTRPKEYRTLKENYVFEIKEEMKPNNNNAFWGEYTKQYLPHTYEFDVNNIFGTINNIIDRKIPINGKPMSSKTQKVGHPTLMHIISLKKDISNKGLDKSTEERKKEYNEVKSQLNWVSSGIYNPGDRLLGELCQGARFLGFDMDDTNYSDFDISNVLGKDVQYLQYTTFSDRGFSDKRRLRVVIPYDKPILMSEHDRIFEYYFKKFEDYSKKNKLVHGFDKPKSQPGGVKLYCPHKESVIQLFHTRTYEGRKINKEPLDTYRILAKTPRKPLVNIPTINDFKLTREKIVNGIKTIEYVNNEIFTPDQIKDICKTYPNPIMYFGARGSKDNGDYDPADGFIRFVSGCKNSDLSYSDVLELLPYVTDSKTNKELKGAWESCNRYNNITPEMFTGMIKGKLSRAGVKYNSSNTPKQISKPKSNTDKWTGTKVITETIYIDEPKTKEEENTLQLKQLIHETKNANDSTIDYRTQVTKMPVIGGTRKSYSALHKELFDNNNDDILSADLW